MRSKDKRLERTVYYNSAAAYHRLKELNENTLLLDYMCSLLCPKNPRYSCIVAYSSRVKYSPRLRVETEFWFLISHLSDSGERWLKLNMQKFVTHAVFIFVLDTK